MAIGIANQRIQNKVLCNAQLPLNFSFRFYNNPVHCLPNILQGMTRLTVFPSCLVTVNKPLQHLVAMDEFLSIMYERYRCRSSHTFKNRQLYRRVWDIQQLGDLSSDLLGPVLSCALSRVFEEPHAFIFPGTTIPELPLASHFLGIKEPFRFYFIFLEARRGFTHLTIGSTYTFEHSTTESNVVITNAEVNVQYF